MALNLNALRGKLEDLQKTGENKKFERDPRLWIPNPGENKIRIIPLKEQTDNPFIKLNFHYEVCKGGKLSLKNFGEQDPIIDFALAKVKEGNEISFNKSNPDPERGKKLYFLGNNIMGGKKNISRGEVVPRYNCLIIDRNNGNDEHFWAHSEAIFTEIVKAALTLQQNLEDFDKIKAGEEVDFTDPVNGHDLIVIYKPSIKRKDQVLKSFPDYKGEFSETAYGETTVEFENKATILTEDEALAEKIINEQLDIFDIFAKPTFEELKTDLDAYLEKVEREANSDTSHKAEVKYTKPAETENKTATDFDTAVDKPKEEVKAAPSEEVEKAKSKFDNLFN